MRGIHHDHIRKRRAKSGVRMTKWKHVMDRMIYFVAVFGPVMTIPQLTKIWIDQNASGLSIYTWSAYIVTSSFWLIYGITHKEKPLIFTYSIWVVMASTIAVGIYLFS